MTNRKLEDLILIELIEHFLCYVPKLGMRVVGKDDGDDDDAITRTYLVAAVEAMREYTVSEGGDGFLVPVACCVAVEAVLEAFVELFPPIVLEAFCASRLPFMHVAAVRSGICQTVLFLKEANERNHKNLCS